MYRGINVIDELSLFTCHPVYDDVAVSLRVPFRSNRSGWIPWMNFPGEEKKIAVHLLRSFIIFLVKCSAAKERELSKEKVHESRVKLAEWSVEFFTGVWNKHGIVSTLNTFAADDFDMKFRIDHLLGELCYSSESEHTKFACIVYTITVV